MSLERMDEQLARLNSLSERLFGDATEVEPAEAEELLRSAGIEPAKLKDDLYQRMLERSEAYTRSGQPPPALLTQALEDLQGHRDGSANESTSIETANIAIANLLKEIGELPRLLGAGVFSLSFTAAYRNRRELSTRDKMILDGVAEDLRKKNA
jgi:hypothetical protein